MTFERRLEQTKAVLSKLSRQPMRWTLLLKATIQVCGSPPRLHYILKFLKKNGFVKRVVVNKKLHWAITEKGEAFLNLLSEINT